MAAGVNMDNKILEQLFANNQRWADERTREDPDYFKRLSAQQAPEFLWIGCADSRIPANQVIGLAPGEVFVHRNVANLVVHTDFNCLSVMQYAVDVLRVKHVIVCGHYGCGGVRAAMERPQVGLSDNWLRHIRDIYAVHKRQLDRIHDEQQKYRRLVELNARQQALNVCHTTIVQNAWSRGQPLTVHALVYDLADGLLRDLNFRVDGPEHIEEIYMTLAPSAQEGSANGGS
jgi:carbonic anhydrase